MENEIENENRNVIIKENEITRKAVAKENHKCNINTCKHWVLRKFLQIKHLP